MPNNIKITPASALIEFSGATSSNVSLSVSANGDVKYIGTTNGDLLTLSDTTGVIAIKSASFGTSGVTISTPTGTIGGVYLKDGAVTRWDMTTSAANDLTIRRYNASGALVDTPISINPTTGVVTIPNLAISAGTSLNASTLNNQPASFYLNLTNSTGVLAASKGGTGLSAYTPQNFIRAATATTFEQRTPDQVRRDIGATKTYFGDEPPLNPEYGDRWIDAVNGVEYVWFNDGDSDQWFGLGGASSLGGGCTTT